MCGFCKLTIHAVENKKKGELYRVKTHIGKEEREHEPSVPRGRTASVTSSSLRTVPRDRPPLTEPNAITMNHFALVPL